MTRVIVGSIEGEYRRHKTLAERAMAQVADDQLIQPAGAGNSIATLVWHLSGNLASRFTDFLGSDGEKPWRDRESEFARRAVPRQELREKWDAGWSVLFASLASLRDADLDRQVTIRGVAFAAHEALHRSLAHTAYHVGQIVFLARLLKGGEWAFLTIPPGQSDAYNANPVAEKPPRQP